jgi:outer membrane protein TolC
MPRSIRPALLAAFLCAAPCAAQDAPVRLTLEDAIAKARAENPGLRAMRLKLEETRQATSMTFTNYLPRVSIATNYIMGNNEQGILLPKGSLGYVPELGGTFPRSDRNVPQGGRDIFFNLTTVAQPVTHFFKIREGMGVARADQTAASAGVRKAEQDVAFGVLQAYAGVLIAQRALETAREKVTAADLRTGYQIAAVTSGMAAEVYGRQAQVTALKNRQDLLEREGELEDIIYKLVDAIGIPLGTQIELVDPPAPRIEEGSLETYVADALANNPEVLQAAAIVNKASHGVNAARADYIPMIGLIGGHLYQTSVPFFPRNLLAVGVSGSWTLFDWGARGKQVGQRKAQLGQAEQNLEMVRRRVRGEVEAAHRKRARAAEMLDLAEQARSLRTEVARLKIVQASVGYGVDAEAHEASADRLEAEMDLLKARLGYMIAQAELDRTTGALGR